MLNTIVNDLISSPKGELCAECPQSPVTLDQAVVLYRVAFALEELQPHTPGEDMEPQILVRERFPLSELCPCRRQLAGR